MFLCRELLRREWLAGAVIVLLFAAVGLGAGTFDRLSWSTAAQGAILGLGLVVATTRFGLVAAPSFLFVSFFVRDAPSFLHTTAWYSGVSLFALGAVLALAGLSLHVAIGSPLSRSAR
jgi:hypothetical protein